MKKIFLILSLSFFSLAAAASESLVTTQLDNLQEGSLRIVLESACDDDGDDVIHFAKTRYQTIHIMLSSPLVIPPDCHGKVTLEGSSQVETILDGAGIGGAGGGKPGEFCLFPIYSDGHQIKNFTI